MGVSHLPILLVLVFIALIVFGPKRLPELGSGLGRAISEFKKGAAELTGSTGGTTPAASAQPIAMLAAVALEAPGTPAATFQGAAAQAAPAQAAPAPAAATR